MKKLIQIFSVIIILLSINSCKKQNTNPPDKNKINDLIIADGFDFQNIKNIKTNIKLPYTVDFSENRSRVDFYSTKNNQPVKLLQTGSVNKDGVFEGDFSIPSTIDSIYIKSFAGDVVIPIESSAKEDGVNYDYGFDYDTVPPPDTVDKAKSIRGNIKACNILKKSNFKNSKSVNNLIANGDFETNDFGVQYSWYNPTIVTGKWNFVTYNKPYVSRYEEENNNHVLKISTPNGKRFTGGASQYIYVNPGDLITFTSDIKASNSGYKNAYLYLIPRRSNGSPIRFYAIGIYNPSTQWMTKTVTATMPANTEKCQILIWSYSINSSLYFDNVVVTGPSIDSDGDGVDDDTDDYPDDNSRAFNIYFPDISSWGTFAFEDSWPYKGDYDFNDLVIDYQFNQITNANNQLVEVNGKFALKASGASYNNGFGFQIPNLNPSDISSVTGINIQDGYINLQANNTEAGQSKATIIVFDNAFNILPSPGGELGVNTKQGGQYVEPDTLDINFTLTTPISIYTTGTAPYNPFIIIKKTRGREAHLPGYTPTDLVNTDYFGQGSDDTNPANNKYYKTTNNLPWGINIPAPFDYPIEKLDILQAYLHFGEWAESSGNSYTDWYIDNSGYRNSNKIYSH